MFDLCGDLPFQATLSVKKAVVVAFVHVVVFSFFPGENIVTFGI